MSATAGRRAMDSAEEPVDVSVLEALIEVRRQQALVDQFCARAEEMKSAVAAAVYERVLGDYRGVARRSTPKRRRSSAGR